MHFDLTGTAFSPADDCPRFHVAEFGGITVQVDTISRTITTHISLDDATDADYGAAVATFDRIGASFLPVTCHDDRDVFVVTASY